MALVALWEEEKPVATVLWRLRQENCGLEGRLGERDLS